MSYPEAAWERAMTVQEVMLKALSGKSHWYSPSGHSGVIAADAGGVGGPAFTRDGGSIVRRPPGVRDPQSRVSPAAS
jgi:hypothetical protein